MYCFVLLKVVLYFFMKFYLFYIALFIFLQGKAQSTSISIQWKPVYKQIPLKLNTNYTYYNDSILFTTLKFYVTNVTLLNNDSIVYQFFQKQFLIDIEKPLSLILKSSFKKPLKFNKISFNVGVDSATNVSGAMDKALDPIHGMYWTWQSGYINFKVEGKSSACSSSQNKFGFHIGGYQFPYNTLQKCSFNILSNSPVVIHVNIDALMQHIHLKDEQFIMSTNKRGVEIAATIANIFTVAQ